MPSAEPRWATERTPSRKTLGAQAAKIAEALGTPLMPWQRAVFDVALEIGDDGQLVFREVVVTCPRQQGKTTLLLSLIMLRALRTAHQRIAYTAQSGADARSKFERDWIPALRASALNPYVTPKLANGREALKFSNGSLAALMTTTRKSGHGQSIDLGILDEAFGHTDARIEQAIRPAQITRQSAQFWVTSTAGVPSESPYLWQKVENGRQAVESGIREGLCYVEYSAPDDADPLDPAVWWACMPALGHTVTEEAIRDEFATMELSEARRALLNQWVRVASDPVIDLEVWRGCADPRSTIDGPLALAADVTPDRSSAAIAAAGHRADGRWHVEVIDQRPGTRWVADRLKDLVARHRPVAVVIDSGGPAGSLLAELDRAGVTVLPVSASDHARACGAFYDAVVGDQLRHLGTPELIASLDGATKRNLAESWAWSRRSSAVDISPLVACTLALFGADHRGGDDGYAHVFFASDVAPQPATPEKGARFIFHNEEATRARRFKSIYDQWAESSTTEAV